MRIGLIDVDGHNFPNLALMKISAWHKQQGDTVEWYEPMFTGHCEKVYVSKVFSFSADFQYPIDADEVIKGGSGYHIKLDKDGKEYYDKENNSQLPYQIEHSYPDYSLYPKLTKDTAYGFLTRGCPRNCGFCHVCAKEGRKSYKVADLNEFWRGQKFIKLLDPNLLACRDRDDLLKQLIDSNAYIDVTQGFDARFVTDDVARTINSMNIKMMHFAFDSMESEAEVIHGLKTFRKYYKGDIRKLKCYVLTNYDTTLQEDWYRVKVLTDLGYTPYVMICRKGTHPRFLTDLARWSNNMLLKRSTSFEDYIPRKDGKSCGELYSEALKI